MNTQQKLAVARNLVAELYDIRKRPFHYAVEDLSAWLSLKLDRLGILLDEIDQDFEPQQPDQQLILNHEIEESILHVIT